MVLRTTSSGRARHDSSRQSSPRPLARSGSFLGTLKNLIAAPLLWLSHPDDFEDTPGKRRRNPEVAARDEREHAEGEPKIKRKRFRSPTPEQQSQEEQGPPPPPAGYLDVPSNLINAPASMRRNRHSTHGRSASLALQPARHQVRHDRHSHSPFPSASHAALNGMSRTMSMDPPSYYDQAARNVAYRPQAISRDVSMESVYSPSSTRGEIMSPTRTRFNLRSHTSMTPQPSSQTFGPEPHHRERDPSEPPPLADLISNPQFVKPPHVPQQSKPVAYEPTITLGSLADSQQRSHSPLRQHSTLLIGRTASEGIGSGVFRPVNAAEKALHDLDVYKTPLLPTRLRGSTAIPETFQPKRIPKPVLMSKSKDHKPRLGMSDKQGKEDGSSAKPYAGQGGMRKLLARRRMEEEEEMEMDREAAIDEDSKEDRMRAEEPLERSAPGGKHVKDGESATSSRPTVPDFSSVPPSGRDTSLRVGRTRTSRVHPSPIVRAKNRFSALYDDDEADDQMQTAEDNAPESSPKKPVSMFQPPPGFSFANNTSSLKLDSSTSKEPPIPSLPFSLSSSSPSSPSSAPTDKGQDGQKPPVPTSGSALTSHKSPAVIPTGAAGPIPDASAPAPSTPVMQMLPQIALTPPTPGPPASTTKPTSAQRNIPDDAVSSSARAAERPAIPNFFASSSIFSKPGVNIAPPVPSGPLFAKTLVSSPPKSNTDLAPATGVVGSTAQTSQPEATENRETAGIFAATSWGGASGGSVPTSAFSINARAGSGASTPALGGPPTSESLLGKAVPPAIASAPTITFSSGVSEKPADKATNGSFSFAAPVKAAEPSAPTTTLPFSFGVSAKPAEPSTSTSLPFSFGTSAKSEGLASSNTPSVLSPAAKITEPSTASRPFTFGARTTEGRKEEVQKGPDYALPTPAEPLKPSLFGTVPSSSSFCASSGSGATGSTEAAKTPFTFGQPASTTTPAASTSSVQAPKPLFGSGGSSGFSFGKSASNASTEAPAPAKSPFTFGSSPSTPPVASTEKTAFSFGAPPANTGAGSMPFGVPTSGSNGTDVSSKPFTFGSAASTTTRPVTPPRNDQEVNMDESPTRGSGMDTNANGHNHGKEPLKVTTGFSFGAPSTAPTSAPFGQSNPSPFSFGASPSVSNPFGAKPETKVDAQPAGAGFGGFGQSSSSGFPFGQKAPEAPQAPSSSSPFGSSTSFGQSSATPSTTPTFSFGATAASGNAFGQPAANASAPASPSTFGSSAPFSFGTTPTSATAPSNPFAFGSSQPASPAAANPGLPSAPGTASGPFTFGSSNSANTQSPASPFGAAPALPDGPPLFTIGSASAPSAGTGPGNRLVKKLPTRRGAKR